MRTRPNTVRCLIAAAFVVSLLGACGDDGPSAGSSKPTTTTVDAGYLGDKHLRFGDEHPPSTTDTALNLTINTAYCNNEKFYLLERVDVEETDTQILVTPHLVTRPEPEEFACAMSFFLPVPVTLKAPLGERLVLDGTCQPPSVVLGKFEQRKPCTETPRQVAAKNAVGSWSPFDRGPLSPRSEPRSVWTGEEMLIVGGTEVYAYRPLHDGAAYNPATNKWRRIADLPHTGHLRSIVWTGSGLITLSQAGTELLMSDANVVHRYDAASNKWSAGATGPAGLKMPYAYWTGTELIVWSEGAGALYNPSTDTWRTIPAIDAQGGLGGTRARWIPQPGVLAVQGRIDPRNGSPTRSGLLLFNPTTNKWTNAKSPPGEISDYGEAAVFGSIAIYDPLEATKNTATYAYDAVKNTWRDLGPIPVDRDAGGAYFNGADMGNGKGAIRVGSSNQPLAFIDLKSGKWTHAVVPPGRFPSPDAVSVWTGDRMLVWGLPLMVAREDLNIAWAWSP